MEVNIISAILAFMAALIGGGISFLLFVLTPNSKMKSKRNEVDFEAMDWTCGALLECITNPDIMQENPDLLKDVQDNIYLYGTNNELRVLSQIKPTMFNTTDDELSGENKYYALASITLLSNVIRHETYKKSIISNYIYNTYIKDYYVLKDDLDSIYNKLVIEFNLSKKYLIK